MKRSEMLLEIAKLIELHCGWDDEINDNLKGAARDILSRLEKLGMSPPKREPSIQELDLEGSPELYRECLYFNTYQSWEPEGK
jgi:hypothetical protein